jgi:hypothetical protein
MLIDFGKLPGDRFLEISTGEMPEAWDLLHPCV